LKNIFVFFLRYNLKKIDLFLSNWILRTNSWQIFFRIQSAPKPLVKPNLPLNPSFFYFFFIIILMIPHLLASYFWLFYNLIRSIASWILSKPDWFPKLQLKQFAFHQLKPLPLSFPRSCILLSLYWLSCKFCMDCKLNHWLGLLTYLEKLEYVLSILLLTSSFLL
jgi:hypothetical protein